VALAVLQKKAELLRRLQRTGLMEDREVGDVLHQVEMKVKALALARAASLL
jgi:hypothetical protein